MKNEIQYTFKPISSCEMCGNKTSDNKLIGRRLNSTQGLRPKKKSGITVSIYKCRNCQLIYSHPQPIPLDIQDHYGVPPEDYWDNLYIDEQATDLGNLPQKIQKYIDFNSNPKLLDIGCGIGRSMIAWKKYGFDSYDIEPSKTFYQKALERTGISEDKISCVAIEDAIFADNYFDFISFGAVLEHLYSPAASIELALKWLKPGGIIEIAVPSSNWLTSKILNFYYKLTFNDYVTNISPMHTPFHLFEFSKKSFEELSKKYPFEIVEFERGICNTMLPRQLDWLLKPTMRYTNTGMEIYLILQKTK